MQEFNFIIDNILPGNKIGHLFIVNIQFDFKNTNEKSYFSMRFILRYLEKNKYLDPFERYVFQLTYTM